MSKSNLGPVKGSGSQMKSTHGTTAVRRGGSAQGGKASGSTTTQKGNPHQKHDGPK